MPLRDEIAELLRMPENGAGAPSLDAIESTLTDGYAEALALEAERSRIERRLGEVARDAGEASAHSVAASSPELSRVPRRPPTASSRGSARSSATSRLGAAARAPRPSR